MQQILAGEALTGVHNHSPKPEYCFNDIWDKQNGVFRPCFLPVISCIPAVVAALLLLLGACSLIVPWRPRPFVQEIVEGTNDDLLPRKRKHGFLAALLGLITAAAAVLRSVVAILLWPAPAAVAPAAAWFAGLGLVIVYKPRTAPFSVLAIFVLQATATLIIILDGEIDLSFERFPSDVASLVLSLLGILIILFMPFRDPSLPADRISKPMTESSATLRSPEDNLSLWQFMTVSWMTPLIRLGYQRQLQDEDVWQLPYEFHHQRLHDNFRLLRGTVVRRLVKANAIDLVILTTLGLLELVLQYSTPLLLQLLLSSMEDTKAPKHAAITYAALSLAVRLIAAQSGVFSLWFGRRCYERSRGEMITMLYEKTLGRKINFATTSSPEKTTTANGEANGHVANGDISKKHEPQSRQTYWQRFKNFFHNQPTSAPVKEAASMGKILNLMRNDVYEVAQRFWEFQELIKKPLGVIFSITLVVHLLGWPSMLAVLVMLLAQGLNVVFARIMVHFEQKRRRATDGKLQVISQFVEAIRHLRWYGWQGSWLTQIISARQKELNLRIVTSIWNLVIALTNTIALDLTPTIAFFAYTVIGKQPLRIDIAFPAMALFNMMTTSLRDLPNLIIVLINAWVAVGRIEDFMAEPDKEDRHTESVVRNRMLFDGASFAWPGSNNAVLKELALSFPKGLTVVFGEVGSGKSALMQALLGELDLLSGQYMRSEEPIGYCAQSPWLQSMSIRDNILFSSPYDDMRYKAVLLACALTPDLAEFKSGDLSLIGENGIGLSGGQRARVALARALYSRAEILLLDDPLSALDQQTAELIVDNLFSNNTYGTFLGGRTVVLATHRTDLVVRLAEQVIEMQDGRACTLDHTAGLPEAAKYLEHPTSDMNKKYLENETAAAVPDKFIEDEHREHGGVKASVYWEYVKAGKLSWWLLLVFVLALYRLVSVAEAWFLKSWGEAYNGDTVSNMFVYADDVVGSKSSFLDRLPPPDENIKPWLVGFLLLGLGKSLCFIISRTVMIVIIYTAAKNMFIAIMERVAGATFRFYDVTPIGRLMNRMTSDISVIDGNISMQFQSVAWLSLSWIGAVLVIGSVTPTFLVFSSLLTVAFVLIFMRFIPTSQSLRRLEMVSLTPLMSNFGALLNGLTTVRAFRVQRQFQDRVVQVVDTFQKMDHFYWSLQAWLMYRYDTLSAISFFLITVLALATNVSAGLTAFVLIAANKLVSSTHQLCKQYGQLQMDFVSVERIVELLHLEQEPKGTISPPAWWPSFSSDISFDDVTIKYAAHMDPALAGVSFNIKGGSKTAIIGRTGSGKSTLALSILATIVPETGNILVDNIDLAEVDKQLLRTRVTFLAQDPVLFVGTMRKNLDPVNEHSDEACKNVLDRVCERQEWDVDTKIEAGGRNLSQGQRQVVGLARAVLRRSAIIILDEATASIDRDTAMQIQQVMHEEMKDSTVITIAHRLEAVRNADYCIELGQGKVIREGPASEMLKRADLGTMAIDV